MKRTGRREWIFITGQCTSLRENSYCIHPSSDNDVKILMAYIVDLICIMQVIFLLAPGDHRVKPETVLHALRAYQTPKKVVHMCVGEFDGKRGVLPGGRERVMDKIEALIWRHSVADHEIEGLRRKINQV